jgi:hypothetical protein
MSSTYAIERKTKRVPALLPAFVRCGGNASTGVAVDLSAGGAGLQLNKLPSRGEIVDVRIHMPGGLVIETQAEVMHAGVADRDRCGLRFRDLDQRALCAIYSFVAAYDAASH